MNNKNNLPHNGTNSCGEAYVSIKAKASFQLAISQVSTIWDQLCVTTDDNNCKNRIYKLN